MKPNYIIVPNRDDDGYEVIDTNDNCIRQAKIKKVGSHNWWTLWADGRSLYTKTLRETREYFTTLNRA